MADSHESEIAGLGWGLSRQELALLAAANRLKGEFAGSLDVATVDQCLHSFYDRLAWRAKVLAFLPLLAERHTRQHLRALTGVGADTAAEAGTFSLASSDASALPLASPAGSSTARGWTAGGARSAESTSNLAFAR